ncbi:TPA: phage tail assembly chaperone [Vibrio vulnificus]|nr:hypothetical protein [Vibrio vulnificus]
MSIYSNKIIKREFNDTIIKAHKLNPLDQQRIVFKCIRAITPSLGSLADSVLSVDRSLVCASAFSMLSQNCSDELFEELQTKLLGAISVDGEPLTTPLAVNSFLETCGVDAVDLLAWQFEEQLLLPLTQSTVFKAASKHLEAVKSVVMGMFTQPEETPTEANEGV